MQGCWDSQAPRCKNTLSIPQGAEPGSAGPKLRSLLMGSQLGMKRWTGNGPLSRVTEQQMQFFRVFPTLPPFFPPEFQQGGLQDGLGATRHMKQKGQSLLGCLSPSPKASAGAHPPCAGWKVLWEARASSGMREGMYSLVSMPRQAATNGAIRRHRHPLGCIA